MGGGFRTENDLIGPDALGEVPLDTAVDGRLVWGAVQLGLVSCG